jgi:hypothetical protein
MSELPLIEIDQRIQSALVHFRAVAQPLSFLIPSLQQEKLNRFLEDPDAYISVAEELPC